jgi:hypothetical protein
MAEQESQNPGATTNTFNKGMVKDYNETFVGEGLYTHARNAVNNSHDGQVGVIGNEPANLYCATLPYTLIGTVHLGDDQWAVFTTDDLNSEIGIFDESACSYTKIINDPCLNFKRTNLITGVSRSRFDCDTLLYWDDGLNPTRVLNINDIPYVCTDSTVNTAQQPFKYKLIGATCPAKTARTTIIYKDINYVSQTKYLVDGEVFEFLSFDKASDMQVTTQSCVAEPCYTHIINITIPTAGRTAYELCLTDQQAYEQQFPGGVLDALTVISRKLDNNGNSIPCGCISQSTTTTPYSLNDVTVISPTSNGIGCTTPICSDRLDCEKIRLASIVKHPCVSLQKGKGAGTLANGSYQVALAYTVDQVKVTDYFGLSEVQSLFSHQNLSGSLEVTITDIDKNFDEFELIVISNINQQTVAKSLGYYSTSQGVIYISSVGPELITVPLTMVVLRTEPIEKSDALYSVTDYLIRVGTYTKFRFNYQQQANAIRSKWVAVQYPSTYYVKGGNNPSFMRDEQYAFFIRWVYNTGERSDSYHIPGRPAVASDRATVAGEDVFEIEDGVTPQRWKVENTATIDNLTTRTLADGGKVIASGQMGYWESTELYPDNKPQIWGALCGQPIRHHKFPDATVDPIINHFNTDGQNIVVLGVQFENITHPLGIDGKPIASVVGYEILRGTREGHKTIVATGVFNNMREYTIQEGTVGVQGLFQNYPYNDLSDDYYLTSNEEIINDGSFTNRKKDPLRDYRKDIFSFHSPDTTFTKPFLSVQEVKLYGEVYGKSQGAFEHPWRHPKNKFIGKDIEFINKALQIVRIINSISSELPPSAVEFTGNDKLPVKLNVTPVKPEPKKTVLGSILGGITNLIAPGAGSAVSGIVDNIAYGINQFSYAAQLVVVKYIHTETTSAQIQILVYGLIPRRQYALQYNSHGFFNKFTQSQTGNRRRKIDDSLYVGGNVQGFDNGFRINNLYRGNFVVIKLPSGKTFANPRNVDNSRVLISDVGVEPRKGFQRNISCHYGAIKIPLPAQYGQLESIKQVPVSTCVGKTNGATGVKFTSDILFGGDVYINKFTEKNTMPFFNDWMIDFPDETAYDYRNYINVPFPRYWMNTAEAEYKLLQSSAKEHHHLDKSVSRFFYIHQGYIYLFNSGVREFFVESEINLAYRDWEDETSKRHYDSSSFTDLSLMFRSDIIRSGNYYKYDYSLSVSKLYSNFISWGNVLPRNYDPETYSTCYTYRPNRAIYSLPQQDEISKDNWRVFLANNYKDFSSRISNIKSVNKNGALFMLADQSPIQFMGVDQLQTDAGTKITIGDGGLFSQPFQNLVNADDSYEYGSNQGRYCSVGTTHGVFWVSQNQGKVFQYAGGLNEISRNGMKWWFAKYLPSELLKAFPDYPLYDNPVSGVGVQMIYDNTHEILYITKKDYKPKFSDLAYDSNGFYRTINGTKTYYTFKSEAFEEASWTISYDPKSKMWISFHDWIPTFLLPGRAHFLSVNSNTVWKHNQRCDKFANFYNKDYPFEVEFISSTGQTVTTVRNIEYLLETYKYHNGCADKFHILDENFDQAIIYNSEQVSGLLEMTLKSKVNPVDMLSYPQVGTSSIKINYSKEENKYRFNQFWDITKNRGEFASNNVPMFNTRANGYQFQINPAYVNYQKPVLERKKFRHNVNKVLLRKLTSNDLKMIFKISNQKIQQSFR